MNKGELTQRLYGLDGHTTVWVEMNGSLYPIEAVELRQETLESAAPFGHRASRAPVVVSSRLILKVDGRKCRRDKLPRLPRR